MGSTWIGRIKWAGWRDNEKFVQAARFADKVTQLDGDPTGEVEVLEDAAGEQRVLQNILVSKTGVMKVRRMRNRTWT